MDSRLEIEVEKKIAKIMSERGKKGALKVNSRSPEEVSAMRKKGWETRRKKNEGNS